jgi:chitinase
MYDAYAYYADQYGFVIAAGVHYPPEPWGPFYEYTHENVADLSQHIYSHPNRGERNDVIMIWQLLLEGTESSAYSYLNVASKALNGTSESESILLANDFEFEPYKGGSEGCGSGSGGSVSLCERTVYSADNQYPNPGTEVVFNCQIWKNKWYINPNEQPGENEGWEKIGDCSEGEGCG